MTLADNLSAEQVNEKLDNVLSLEKGNKFNPSFNSLTDPRVIQFTKGVTPEQVFQIENTIQKPESYVQNNSVVKIKNRFVNQKTNKMDSYSISTQFKKIDGAADDGDKEEAEEAETSMMDGDQSQIEEAKSVSRSEMANPLDTKSEVPVNYMKESTEDVEEVVPDEKKFNKMESDQDAALVNRTKIIKDGSMDDVFVIEKVENAYVYPVLFIHSCVPKIKEFLANMKFNPKVLTSPYMKEFEELLTGLVFFVLEKTDEKDPLKADAPIILQN